MMMITIVMEMRVVVNVDHGHRDNNNDHDDGDNGEYDRNEMAVMVLINNLFLKYFFPRKGNKFLNIEISNRIYPKP